MVHPSTMSCIGIAATLITCNALIMTAPILVSISHRNGGVRPIIKLMILLNSGGEDVILIKLRSMNTAFVINLCIDDDNAVPPALD